MATIRSTSGGWVHAMLGSVPVPPRPMAPRFAWGFIEPSRCALQRLLDGAGAHEDVATVGIAFNMAYLQAAKSERAADLPAFDAAGLVLGALDADGHRAPTDDERETLCIAINLYDTIVRTCQRDQWVNLMFELMELADKGQATV